MEEERRIKNPAPWDYVNIFNKMVFKWVFPIFWRGLKKECLDFDDLYRCPANDESKFIVEKLERNWNNELTKKKPKYWKALFKTFASSYVFPLMVFLFEECFIRIVQPILLGRVIRFFNKSSDPKIEFLDACLSAAGVCLCSAIFISCHHPNLILVMKTGMRMRVACCTIMYKKSLKLSRTSLGKTTVGQIINLMSNDVNRCDEFSIFLSYLIVAPIQTTIIMYIMWSYLEVSFLTGAALLLLFIPFQGLMGRLFSGVRRRTAKLTDNRLKFMNEIISGMRVIKMYAWEKPFSNLVAKARKSEVYRIRQSLLLKALNLSIFFVASRIILFVCFVTYIFVSGKPLDAESVFVTMALFNTLRITTTWLFTQSIALTAEMSVSCKRIQTFLELEENNPSKSITYASDSNDHLKTDANDNVKSGDKNDDKISKNDKIDDKNDKIDDKNDKIDDKNIEMKENGSIEKKPLPTKGVFVSNLMARWSDDVEEPTLRNISVTVQSGELLAVIGTVGSGKSSFLMALLGELPLSKGTIDINGIVAYASQESWSFNSSVRNNILFGCEYNEERYKEVVHVCALERDFTLFPYGDKTLVGERGVSLSGGQKARITLARALYREADIYFLDDPLSAVDSSVAKHIFEKCIISYLKNKARILVTHQMQFIRKANRILVLEDGKCIALGTYDELINSGLDFMSLLNENEEKKFTETQDDYRRRTVSQLSVDSVKSLNPRTYSRQRTWSGSQTENYDIAETPNDDDESNDPKIEEETRTIGSISAGVYWAYIRAGAGPFLMTLTLVSSVLSQAIFHASDFWLTEWTNKNQESSQTDQTFDVIIYSALILALFLTALMRSMSFFVLCMRSSINLHNTIFYKLLRAPISLFDNNPVGRILNRFTKDLGIVDEQLPSTAFDLNLTLMSALGIIIVISIVNYYLIIPAVILIFLSVKIRGIYIKSARDIKRFEGMTRSPIFSHVSITLNGLATVRAFGAQRSFEEQYYRYQDDHTSTWFLFICSSRTLGLVMDWICVVYIFIIAIVTMALHENFLGGSAGLVFSSALMLTGMTQWGVRQSAELESQMTSVERIVEYTKLDSEAELESSPDNKPSPDWPKIGQIQFKNVNMSYDGIPKPVLSDLNFTINGKEKIGIVGRTGAGKSSLLAALFRICESEGNVIIDGIDTKTLGLHDLRKAISIIPQDPVIFTGPVRRNIDPFGENSDEVLWEVITEVQLRDAINELPGKLDTEISEGGSNFSVGQRQLICLARAILKSNKILVIDEATANVDHHTDNLIQETIRKKFAECTVLTIAHRLNTIIDSDRIIVLDAGEVKEFDDPYVLLKQSGSIFGQLIKQTGKSMASQLYAAAKDAHFSRKTENGNAFKTRIFRREESHILKENNEFDSD